MASALKRKENYDFLFYTWSKESGAHLYKVMNVHSIQSAHKVICTYFKVRHLLDRKLVKSIFYTYYPWPAFTLVKKNDDFCIIQFSNPRKSFYSEEVQIHEPLKKDQKLFVEIKNDIGTYHQTLTYDSIKKNRRDDGVMVALFNSHSFKRVTHSTHGLSSHENFFSRTIDKVDLNRETSQLKKSNL